MVERYQLQVDEQKRPNAALQSFPVRNDIGAAVSGLGGEIQRFALIQKERNDKWDAAKVMEATNEYHRVMTDYLINPETGVEKTRLLGNAKGATDDTDRFGDETARNIAAKLENEEQREAFRAIADRTKLSYWSQASRHEAGQIKAYGDGVFNAELEQGLELVSRVPDDDFTYDLVMRQNAAAIRAKYYGADEKTLNAAIQEYQSTLMTARFNVLIKADPAGAKEWYGKRKESFLREDRAKAEEALRRAEEAAKRAAQSYRTQQAVDDLTEQFPPGQEREGLIYIHKRFSGDDEEEIARKYKTRINELEVKKINVEQEVRKAQNKVYEALSKDFSLKREIPPQEELAGCWKKIISEPISMKRL